MKGITSITKGRVALTIPSDTPSDEVWRYGLGFPFQVGPKKAALFCNIRVEGKGSIDFENGTDVILFDTLSDIRPDEAIPLSRNKMGASSVTVKFPVGGGFVPFGAKQPDGSPHPHAGTGFGISHVISHTFDQNGRFDYREHNDRFIELFQFAYDGNEFRVLQKERVELEMLFSEWVFAGVGLTNAIPDGNDLLFPMTVKHDDAGVEGVARWQKGERGWRPISFVPVTEKRAGDKGKWVCGGEPSLIRDGDGSLLFSARSSGEANFDAAVWHSTDNGETWEQVIYRKDCRSRSPVSINQAADGTPFVAANLPPLDRTREVLCYWTLNEDRTDFEECRIARDAPAEFGPAPSGSWWRIDHPTSAIVRLKDGAWHSLLAYRIVDNGEVEGDADPPPQTGCYVEEVLSSGEAIPTWRF